MPISLALPLAASLIALAPAADVTPRQSLIPPVVLQGCSEKVNASHANILLGGIFGHGGIGNAQGAQTVGFDLSFVNTSEKVANLVMIRVGHTDFAKVGMFTPNAVIAWRIAAKVAVSARSAPFGSTTGASGIIRWLADNDRPTSEG